MDGYSSRKVSLSSLDFHLPRKTNYKLELQMYKKSGFFLENEIWQSIQQLISNDKTHGINDTITVHQIKPQPAAALVTPYKLVVLLSGLSGCFPNN